jgi:hypothetical protein
MTKSRSLPYDKWGIPFVVAIFLGLFLSAFLFSKFRIIGFIGISLLIFALFVLIVIRRRVSALKRANPEVFKVLEPKDETDASKCAICGREPAFLYRCYYCRKYFCEEHKLPKSHHCSSAPPTSFRTVILTCTIMISVGIAILYLFHSSLSWVFISAFVILFGTMLLIGRSWEERRSKRVMGLG